MLVARLGKTKDAHKVLVGKPFEKVHISTDKETYCGDGWVGDGIDSGWWCLMADFRVNGGTFSFLPLVLLVQNCCMRQVLLRIHYNEFSGINSTSVSGLAEGR